jgi:hypothetical protein
MDTNLITKIDFVKLRSDLKEDILKIDHKIDLLKNELLIKLGRIIVVSIMTGIAIVAAIVKYL